MAIASVKLSCGHCGIETLHIPKCSGCGQVAEHTTDIGKSGSAEGYVAERMRNMLQPIATHIDLEDNSKIPDEMKKKVKVEAKESLDEIVQFLEDEGDMEEYEIVSTLKELSLKLPFRRPKYVLGYPCYFTIYNSKSAVQIDSSIRVQD